MDDPEVLVVSVREAEAGARLDRFLAASLPDLSRSRLKALIGKGRVRIGARTIAEPSYRVKPGEEIEVADEPPEDALPQPQNIPLDVLFEDTHLIVINKPAGMVVHPAAGNPDGTLVNALLHHCGDSLSGIGGVRRPGIVHRLDKDTSGVMVAAKTDAAHQGLSDLFARHDIERRYVALVRGVPFRPKGTIEGNIGRDPRNRQRMAIVDQGGRHAVTHYRIRERFGEAASLLECTLETGRTHQIRVHLAHLGHPVVGDPAYGRLRPGSLKGLDSETRATVRAFPRQALHAEILGFVHPVTGEAVRLETVLPDDLQALVNLLLPSVT